MAYTSRKTKETIGYLIISILSLTLLTETALASFKPRTITIENAHASLVQANDPVGTASKPSDKLDDGAGKTAPATVEEKVCKKWGSECKIALAVMKGESQGDPRRIGDQNLTFKVGERVYGASYGLFQLRDLPGRFEKPEDMLDEDKNIEYAYAMWKKSGWQPWSAFKNGTYLRYL